jgi:hypothetical protein
MLIDGMSMTIWMTRRSEWLTAIIATAALRKRFRKESDAKQKSA